jgi:hypothetical protein
MIDRNRNGIHTYLWTRLHDRYGIFAGLPVLLAYLAMRKFAATIDWSAFVSGIPRTIYALCRLSLHTIEFCAYKSQISSIRRELWVGGDLPAT